MHRLGLLGCAVLLIAACGSDEGDASQYVGMYEVTHHTSNDTSCDTEGDPVTDFDYFQLLEDDFLGQTFLSFGECATEDPSSCSSGGIFGGFFRVRGEWVNELYSSSGGGSVSCFLGYVRGVMLPLEDGSLRFETRSYGEEDDTLSEDECDPDTAEARGTDMPCESYVVVEGSPLSAAP